MPHWQQRNSAGRHLKTALNQVTGRQTEMSKCLD